MPLSSVRGRRGELATYADAGRIARWLASSGCTLWQHLPLSEVSPGQDSPYAASSSCALDPVYIDLDAVEDFVALGGEASLPAADRAALENDRGAERVDFEAVRRVKRRALGQAFGRFRDAELSKETARAKAFAAFRREQRAWVEDWAFYRALHDQREKSWRDWEPGLRDRDEAALAAARHALREVIDGLAYTQWIADTQWRTGRREANEAGVKIIGDLPFMVAEDSADVWGLQRFFRFDATVGVPPDAYSAEGQDWGLPVPRWDQMREAGDPWLRLRAERAAELFDGVRVDHVVGLYRTYVRPIDKSPPYFVPADEPSQKLQGERVLALLGARADVLAEDLGVVPPFVRVSLSQQEIPGTKVLRWEDDAGAFRNPATFPAASLAVTGTHDTEALAVWWEALKDHERAAQLKLPQLSALAEQPPESLQKFDEGVHAALLEMLYSSGSDSVLTPITDALGWRDRLNTPGTVGPHNWTWRLPFSLDALSSAPEGLALQRRFASLAKRHRRLH